jgi:hypothetical protein
MYRWRLPRRHTFGNLLGSEGLGERSRQAQIRGYNKIGLTFERRGQPLVHG